MRGFLMALGIVAVAWCSTLVAAEAPSVADLASAASATDPAVAIDAIDALGRLGPQAKDALPALLQALDSPDESVRWHAERTLGSIGPAATAAVPKLLAALDNPSALVKAYAAFALGQIGKDAEPAIEKLVERAFDADPLVRRAVLRAIHAIGAPLEKTRPLFLKILEEERPDVVLPMLHSLAEAGAQAVGPLCEVLKDSKACYWACVALQDIGPAAAAAVPQLIDVLSHQQPEVRMQALLALAAIGSASAPATPEIVKLLENDEFEAVRFSAAFALGAIGQKDQNATKALIAGARSDKPILRLVSVWVLARQNPDKPGLLERAAQMMAKGLVSEDAELRTVAAKLLAGFDGHAEIVGPALAAALTDSDPRVVEYALDALAALGPKILPRVSDALQDKARRHYATALIYRLGPQAAPVVPKLVEALSAAPTNDDDQLFRVHVQRALAAIGPAAAPALPELIKSLSSKNELVRVSACYALGKLGPAARDAVPVLEKQLGAHEADTSDTVVVWALLQIQPGDQQLETKAVPLLVKSLGHGEEIVRTEAATALGNLAAAAQPEVLGRLKELATKDDSVRVREAAAEAVEKLEARQPSP